MTDSTSLFPSSCYSSIPNSKSMSCPTLDICGLMSNVYIIDTYSIIDVTVTIYLHLFMTCFLSENVAHDPWFNMLCHLNRELELARDPVVSSSSTRRSTLLWLDRLLEHLENLSRLCFRLRHHEIRDIKAERLAICCFKRVRLLAGYGKLGLDEAIYALLVHRLSTINDHPQSRGEKLTWPLIRQWSVWSVTIHSFVRTQSCVRPSDNLWLTPTHSPTLCGITVVLKLAVHDISGLDFGYIYLVILRG